MPEPKVSVIICTYNQQDFIRETVESVLSQTYSHLEIIVSDDGSTDDTPRILSDYAHRFPDKLKVVLSPKNTGIPNNINRGLALRTGELSAWLDGDDVMLPHKIEKQVACLQNHPEAIGCYHDAEVFDSTTGAVLGSFCQIYNGTTHLRQGKIENCIRPRYFSIPSSVMCYSAACPPHGYDERLKYLSELLFFIETFRTGIMVAIDEQLVRYRRHTHNVTDDPAARKLFYEYELMVYAILEARYPELYPLVKKLRLSCLLTEALRCYRDGNDVRGQALIWHVIRDGAPGKGLAVLAGVWLMRGQLSVLTSGPLAARPAWVKKLSQLILK
jgi:glycosyltransferase involved in cell wall biosynthesis